MVRIGVVGPLSETANSVWWTARVQTVLLEQRRAACGSRQPSKKTKRLSSFSLYSAPSAYASTGGHVLMRFRSPYALSTRDTGVQNLC